MKVILLLCIAQKKYIQLNTRTYSIRKRSILFITDNNLNQNMEKYEMTKYPLN